MFCLYPNGTAGLKDPGDPTNRSSPSIHHTHFAAHIDPIPQITTLTLQLEASFAHNTNLNTRLLTALDTLDTLQAELDAERRKNDKHLWVNLIQELQREKEEMKDVVGLLLKRGKSFIPTDPLCCSSSLPFEPFQSRDPTATSPGGHPPRCTYPPLRVS